MSKSFHPFIVPHAANALVIGVQLVAIAWLGAGVLHLAPHQIAVVQAMLLVPNILLLPLAGALSDRLHWGNILVSVNVVLVLIHAVVVVLLQSQQLSFVGLLVYGLLLGCCNSFIQSAREKMVASLAIGELHNRISLAGIAQQLAQAVGIVIAGMADWIGWSNVVMLQSALCGIAAGCYFFLKRDMGVQRETQGSLVLEIKEGFALVWQCVAARHLILVVAFNGMMHMGALMVLLPVMARDKMHFATLQYSLLQLCFALGGTLVQWFILRKKGPHAPGQGVLFCLLYAGLLALGLAYGPTEQGLFAILFLWGCVSGASANLGRLVVQSVIPTTHRGRAMAVYQLALFGSAPIGALGAGWLLTHWSLEFAFSIVAYSSMIVFFLSFFSRSLWAVVPAQPESLGSASK